MTLEDQIDVARGDLIVTPDDLPTVASEVDVTLCWTGTAPLRPGARYALKHTTRNVGAFVTDVLARRDIDTLEEVAGGSALVTNDIARVCVRTTSPFAFDTYRTNRAMGSFILMDEVTNETAAGALIGG